MKKYENSDELLDKIFDRFKLDKQGEKEEIDLQDFVIGLAVLSRFAFLDKIKCKDLMI